MKKSSIVIIFLILNLSGLAQNISDLVQEGKLEEIRKLLALDKSLVNKKDNEGDIPLCTSILYNQPEISLFLINNGADINNQNQDGYAPIHWASYSGDSLITKVLIERGANFDLVTKFNKTALHIASSRGHYGVVKLLVMNGALLEKNDNYKRTPLLLAARESGVIKIVEILVEGGANIDATDVFGDTPLSLAAWRGYNDIVDYLLGKNAQFTTEGREGIKLFKYSIDKRLWNLYKSMIAKGKEGFFQRMKEYPLLHWAAGGGSYEITQDMISKGIQVNTQDVYKWLPLHYAAYFGRLEIAKLLLEEGADLNVRTPLGETPLYLAKLENNKEVVDFLNSIGAVIELPGSTQLSGKYIGQKEPGQDLQLFAPGIVSRLKGGHSNIVFSPDGTEAFWTEWVLNDLGYSGNNIVWHTKIKKGVWSLPEKFLLDGDVPVFSIDGRKIFLLTKNSITPENNQATGIYYYEREGDEFIGPKLLNFDVNNSGLYWQFTFDRHENIYFSTDEGLFRSIKREGKYLDKECLTKIFHPDYKGESPYISPEGDYIIFSSMELPDSFGSIDLYIGYRKSDGTWLKPINMGSTINSSAIENLAMVSPDGKCLFFRTERNGVSGIYWVSAKIIEELKPKDL